MEEKSPQTLKTGKISKLFWYYTLPSIFMLITQNIAYFVDSIFIGQYVGAEGLSALTLVMPFIIFLAGFAYMIAVGGITLAGIERGAGNTKESNNLFNVTLVLLLILGVLGGIFIHSFVPQLMRWIGTSESSVELIKTTSVNWWFALRLKASLTGLGLKGPLSGFPLCTTFTH